MIAGTDAFALAARGLAVAFGPRTIVEDVALSVGAGDVAVIEGPSGGGKSTLLRALATLEPLTRGEILLDGLSASVIPPTEFRRRVAYVPQIPAMFARTVSDNVRAGPRLRGEELSEDRVADLLRRAAMDPAAGSRIAHELSGGEKQRVAIARALANDPKVILFDEPTSALDPETRLVILELVRQCAANGRAVVVVTHARADADALGGTRWVCEGGRVEQRGGA